MSGFIHNMKNGKSFFLINYLGLSSLSYFYLRVRVFFTFNHNTQLKPMTLTFPHRCTVMRCSPHNHTEASHVMSTTFHEWCSWSLKFSRSQHAAVPVVQLVFFSDLLQHKSFWPLPTDQEVQIWMFVTKLWDDPAK